MGCLSNFCGGNSMWWILILLLILDDNGGGTCDSLIWILLLSRFCGNGTDNASSCGCGCGNSASPIGRTCGC